jgi:hypothetical protein
LRRQLTDGHRDSSYCASGKHGRQPPHRIYELFELSGDSWGLADGRGLCWMEGVGRQPYKLLEARSDIRPPLMPFISTATCPESGCSRTSGRLFFRNMLGTGPRAVLVLGWRRSRQLSRIGMGAYGSWGTTEEQDSQPTPTPKEGSKARSGCPVSLFVPREIRSGSCCCCSDLKATAISQTRSDARRCGRSGRASQHAQHNRTHIPDFNYHDASFASAAAGRYNSPDPDEHDLFLGAAPMSRSG